MRMLAETGLLNPFITMQEFSLINHDATIDKIKQQVVYPETLNY